MADETDLENMTLSDLFDKGWKIQQNLQKETNENDESYSIKRKQAIEILEKCSYMLSELHLFSENESLEEVSTSELRYFLNEGLLGWLFSKVNSTNSCIRLTALEQAKESIIKFLKLTKCYEFHILNIDKFKNDDDTRSKIFEFSLDKQKVFDLNMINHAYERTEKIKRFKEQKEIEAQLNAYHNTPNIKIDDEQERTFFTMLIKYWINKSIDDLKVINDEINILKSIELEKINRASSNNQSKQSSQTANAMNDHITKKPFIITRDALQAKVFGAGYPSVPVYSVEEFYDQLADKGMMPKHESNDEKYAPVKIGEGVTDSQKDKEKAEKDILEDKYDDNELKKQREWDEFKDDNKRGSGNRFNRS